MAITEISLVDLGVMIGFTVFAAQTVGVLDQRFPNLQAYLGRLQQRPALQRAMAVGV